jgi:hypothetical protein
MERRTIGHNRLGPPRFKHLLPDVAPLPIDWSPGPELLAGDLAASAGADGPLIVPDDALAVLQAVFEQIDLVKPVVEPLPVERRLTSTQRLI